MSLEKAQIELTNSKDKYMSSLYRIKRLFMNMRKDCLKNVIKLRISKEC